MFGGGFYLLAFVLPLLPHLLQVSALVYVGQVEIGFPLGLRHLGAKPLLQHHLLVGQPFTQVSPLEPVQILPTDKDTQRSQLPDAGWLSCFTFSVIWKTRTSLIYGVKIH